MMRRAAFVLLFAVFMSTAAFGATKTTVETITFKPFGKVTIYRATPRPTHVVLFVSGDGGWNLGVVDMAKALSSLDALVAGIDMVHYYHQLAASPGACSYPAADLESLSHFLQKKYEFPDYVLPVLVGYSSGATLVYAAMAQGPPNTFLGAVSMGFCPELPLKKPLCKGSGLEWGPGPKGKGYSFLPAKHLPAPWITFQGTIDKVCDAKTVEAYVKQVDTGELILLPKVGHGFSVQRNWMPQFREAFTSLVNRKNPEETVPPDDLKDLPVVEMPAKKLGPDILAVVITGDGGWASIDRKIAGVFSEEGIPVAGLNSLRYLWTARTPKGASHDLERIISHYLRAWDKKRVVLVGYSLGADILPFMMNRLSHEEASRITLAALIGPGRNADFEFHLTDWLGEKVEKFKRPVLPEMEKIQNIKVLCLYGNKETGTSCRKVHAPGVKVIPLKGGHHFGGNYRALAKIILDDIPAISQ